MLLKKLTYFNLILCFTFYSKYNAQTLATVPLEILPQGRNISLDKHLEHEAWQDAAPQKFQSRLSLCAASQQLPLRAEHLVPLEPLPHNFRQKPGPDKDHKVLFCFPIIAKLNPFTSTILPH